MLRSAVRPVGMAIVDTAAHLGHDCDASQLVRPIQGQRWAALARRSRLLRGLAQPGAPTARVFSVGVRSAAKFGRKSLGAPPRRLVQLRSSAAAALPGCSVARSSRLLLSVYRSDPFAVEGDQPMVFWARMLWDKALPVEVTHRAWARGAQAAIKGDWNDARSPPPVVALSLRRLGILWPSPDVFVLDGLTVALKGLPGRR